MISEGIGFMMRIIRESQTDEDGPENSQIISDISSPSSILDLSKLESSQKLNSPITNEQSPESARLRSQISAKSRDSSLNHPSTNNSKISVTDDKDSIISGHQQSSSSSPVELRFIRGPQKDQKKVSIEDLNIILKTGAKQRNQSLKNGKKNPNFIEDEFNTDLIDNIELDTKAVRDLNEWHMNIYGRESKKTQEIDNVINSAIPKVKKTRVLQPQLSKNIIDAIDEENDIIWRQGKLLII